MPTTSGIKTSDDVREKYDKVFKKDSKSKVEKLPYAVFKFNNATDDEAPTEVVVDYDPAFYDKQYSYDELLTKLPKNSPRYFCYDLPHLDKDKNPKSSVVVVSWVPGGTPVKMKFITGSTFLQLVNQLNVNKNYYIEGGDADDVSIAMICKNLGSCLPAPTGMNATVDVPVNINPKD